MKQTRNDLHEMHKANVRRQTELDEQLKELMEQEVQKEVEELKKTSLRGRQGAEGTTERPWANGTEGLASRDMAR